MTVTYRKRGSTYTLYVNGSAFIKGMTKADAVAIKGAR